MKRENYIRIAEETMEFTENLIQKQEYQKCEKVEGYSTIDDLRKALKYEIQDKIHNTI